MTIEMTPGMAPRMAPKMTVQIGRRNELQERLPGGHLTVHRASPLAVSN